MPVRQRVRPGTGAGNPASIALECTLTYASSDAVPSLDHVREVLRRARQRPNQGCSSPSFRAQGCVDPKRGVLVLRLCSSDARDCIAQRMQDLVFALCPDDVDLRWGDA